MKELFKSQKTMNTKTVIPKKFAVYQVGRNPYSDLDNVNWGESDLTDALIIMNRIGEVNDNDYKNKYGQNGVKFSPLDGIKVTITPAPGAWSPNHAILEICDNTDRVLLVGTTGSIVEESTCVDILVWIKKKKIPATVFVRIWW